MKANVRSAVGGTATLTMRLHALLTKTRWPSAFRQTALVTVRISACPAASSSAVPSAPKIGEVSAIPYVSQLLAALAGISGRYDGMFVEPTPTTVEASEIFHPAWNHDNVLRASGTWGCTRYRMLDVAGVPALR